MEMNEAYETLFLPQDSPPEIVRFSYRLLARTWHPDKNPNDREVAKERMKKINEAYGVINSQTSADPRWNFLDYEFKDLKGDDVSRFDDLRSNLFGFEAFAHLDAWSAEIHKVRRVDHAQYLPPTGSTRRSDFYLHADPKPAGFRNILEIELEDILIAVARGNGEQINPKYVIPTLRYYGVEALVEPRIDEFCQILSEPEVDADRVVTEFSLDSVLPKDDENFRNKKTLFSLKNQINQWVYLGGISETPEGGLKISYSTDLEDLIEVDLSPQDYLFIKVLVFGGKMLNEANSSWRS